MGDLGNTTTFIQLSLMLNPLQNSHGSSIHMWGESGDFFHNKSLLLIYRFLAFVTLGYELLTCLISAEELLQLEN